MSIECIVPGCTSNQLTKTLFPFPVDPILLAQWTSQLEKLGFDRDTNTCFICELHFQPHELTWGMNGVRCLVSGAVPKIIIGQDYIDLNACRFCLKMVENTRNRVLIDEFVRDSFSYLMNEPLNADENLPDTCCRVCYSDLKYSSFVKKRIDEAQIKLKNLLSAKESFPTGSSDPFVHNDVGKTIKLEIVMDDDEMDHDNDADFDNDFDNGEMPEYKAELVESSNVLVLPKDEDNSRDKSDDPSFSDCFVKFPTDEGGVKRKRGRPSRNDVRMKKLKMHSCKKCTKSFSTKADLLVHKIEKHSKNATDYLTENETERRSTSKERPKIQCLDCMEVIYKSEFWKHKEQVHNFKRDTSCDVCGLELPNTKELKTHLKTHSTEDNPYTNKNYECFLCGKLLSNLFSLRKHRLSIHPKNMAEKQYAKLITQTKVSTKVPCPECGLMFLRISLRSHIRRIHERIKNYQCDLCGHNIYTKKAMLTHMEVHHMKDREKVKCQVCAKEFANSSSLRGHIKTIHLKIKTEVCEVCGLSYPTKQKYRDHVRSKHTLEKFYKCQECDSSFTTAVQLFKHKANTHNKRPTQCDICFKVYQSLRSMQDHKRLSHREKKYVCEFENCQRSFAARSQLTTHMGQHTDTRRWQCENCDSVYKQRYHLVRHIRAAHMNFLMKCEVIGCSSQFTRKDFYKSHILSHHRDLSEEYLEFLLENIRKIKEPQVKPEELSVQRIAEGNAFNS